MMASNILSRLLPSTAGSPSVYEALRDFDESSDVTDIEERAGIALLDEENLADHAFELDPALVDTMDSQLQLDHSTVEAEQVEQGGREGTSRTVKATRLRRTPMMFETDDLDDEVPLSLLIEENQSGTPVSPEHRHARHEQPNPPPILVAGRAISPAKAKWQAAQQQQQQQRQRQSLHQEPPIRPARVGQPFRTRNPLAMVDPKEKAMWRWANVENLDNFLRDVYDYFIGNGIWCILLGRILNLL